MKYHKSWVTDANELLKIMNYFAQTKLLIDYYHY